MTIEYIHVHVHVHVCTCVHVLYLGLNDRVLAGIQKVGGDVRRGESKDPQRLLRVMVAAIHTTAADCTVSLLLRVWNIAHTFIHTTPLKPIICNTHSLVPRVLSTREELLTFEPTYNNSLHVEGTNTDRYDDTYSIYSSITMYDVYTCFLNDFLVYFVDFHSQSFLNLFSILTLFPRHPSLHHLHTLTTHRRQ